MVVDEKQKEMEENVMNKKIIQLVLIFCLVLGFNSVAAARNIDFENHTNFHWVELYISYDGQGHGWNENLLNRQIDRGDAITINVHRTQREVYKLKIVERSHGEYKEVIWHNVNLEDASRVIMHYNYQDGTASYNVVRG